MEVVDAPRRILLAEDNTINQQVAVTLLRRRGHHVTVAGTGREALDHLRTQEFDLVLMDVQMPEMGRFEASAAIRADESASGRRLPIFAITAHAMKGGRERCLEAGMDDSISNRSTAPRCSRSWRAFQQRSGFRRPRDDRRPRGGGTAAAAAGTLYTRRELP